MKYVPHNYQQFGENHIIDNPAAGLFMQMGLGKTVVTLTAINRLIYQELEVERVLVVAPKRVAENTWTTEADKWDHLRHLRISKVMGTERQRIDALRKKADVYVIGRDNVAWLVGYCQTAFPFDMLVLDELSSFKNAKSRRFKTLRMVRPLVRRIVGLTGTPRPNGLPDLWPQMYLLDQGQRLGKTLTSYREKYLTPGRRNGKTIYEYKVKGDDTGGLLGADIYEREIYEKIADICVSMKTEDYLTLPGRISRTVDIALPESVKSGYDRFEREQVLALADVGEITAVNAATLAGKLLQYANGAIYDQEKRAHTIHEEKIDALREILESANGEPVLVFYSFRHDLDRIKRALAGFNVRELHGPADIEDWNAGKIDVFLLHPASAGHGLNLQAGGHIIVWFGPTWSLELYQQANARLDRQGQTEAVIIHHLIAKGTIDEIVMKRMWDKDAGQEGLLFALRPVIERHGVKLAA